MNSTIYRYPLDPTGVSPDNLIKDEEHQLSNRTVRVVAPQHQGFYATGVVVTDVATNLVLERGANKDYVFGELYEFPTGAYKQEIWGVIVIKKPGVTKVKITYQCLGGNYSYSMDAIIAALDNLNLGNRPVAWPDVIGKPLLFDPASHFHDVGDVYGFEYLTSAIYGLRNAVLLGDVASHDEIYRYIDKTSDELQASIAVVSAALNTHATNYSNPHQTTKAQVGLGLVNNYPMASIQEMDAGASNVTYTSPTLVNRFVTTNAVVPLNNHMNNLSNPHKVTKAQVGLGAVQNYPIASQAEMNAGAANVYTNPVTVKNYVDTFAIAPLAEHARDIDNPHKVTKAQVGLSNVSNFVTADTAVAQNGVSESHFMTPGLVRQEITRLAITPIQEHVNNFTNPHQTTATQIGLGLVRNYPVATQEQMDSGSADDLYVTPNLVDKFVRRYVIADLNNHLTNLSNPHQTTKAQVGLGDVENYGIASIEQMEAGAVDNKVVSPYLVSRFVTNAAVIPLNNHIFNISNPHQVTKSQVGLGNVDNFPTATLANMNSGVGGFFTTPAVVTQYIETHVAQPLFQHVNNFANPHNTTKAQVGLGNVVDYGVATQQQMDNGATNAYVTPNVVQAWVVGAVYTPLINHMNNLSNPHNTTAAQVGLGNVYNYGVASLSEALLGESNTVYMTPYLVSNVIATTNTGLYAHVARTDNPHQTTAVQVGLGNVNNYRTASQTDMNNGIGDAFVTPNVVQAWVTGAVTPFNNHIVNYSNPHGTTAAQVGLGNVSNFPAATQQQMDTGVDNAYATPRVVAAWVVDNVYSPLYSHTVNYSNPHQTTAVQVGLGNVNNYRTATQADMNNGVSDAFATPTVVQAWVVATVYNPLYNHVNNYSNPHGTTAAQVGLGFVQNYGMANTAMAQAGWDNTSYMTPYTTRLWMDAQFGNYLTNYKATFSEAITGQRDDVWITPFQLKTAITDRLTTTYMTRDEIVNMVNNYAYSFTSGVLSYTYAYTSSTGSPVFNDNSNYFDVFPPSGKTMTNLASFISSIALVNFAGTVDGNDAIRCYWSALSDRVRVWVGNTEQRSLPAANWLAVWH